MTPLPHFSGVDETIMEDGDWVSLAVRHGRENVESINYVACSHLSSTDDQGSRPLQILADKIKAVSRDGISAAGRYFHLTMESTSCLQSTTLISLQHEHLCRAADRLDSATGC